MLRCHYQGNKFGYQLLSLGLAISLVCLATRVLAHKDNSLYRQNGFSAVTVAKSAAGQDEIILAQKEKAYKREVTVTAAVFKLLHHDNIGIPHQRFLIKLNNGTTVLVAHDTSCAPYVPFHVGDTVCIHGEYIWNTKGGILHWTHHSNTTQHEDGWIEWQGKRYW